MLGAEKALEGIKVLEFASFVSGPYCSKLLADLGAEVIKIEEPGIGDEARRRGPYLDDMPHPEKSGLFLYLNTNKLSVTLDPKTKTGKKVLLELVKWADILIGDKSPRETQGLGLTYETLKAINPKLVMTSITPFGQTGPYRDYKAYGLNVVHGSGGGYLTPSGSPNAEREPLKGGGFFDDYIAGLSAATATVIALYYCMKTGSGQHVDVSKQEALMATNRVEITNHPNLNTIATRVVGRASPGRQPRSCQDGYVQIAAFIEWHWERFKEFMGNPDWAQDSKFDTLEGRSEYADELYEHIEEWTKGHTKEEIYHGLQKKGVPTAMVCNVAEVMNSPQYKARRFFIEVEHPEMGKVICPRGLCTFSETPWALERPAPLLGQHNEEVYTKLLGLTREALVKMREAGII
jgi:crotonobetainyl-CoA:carnitine CoA-transferase CaiB-like acyl-CoA transferase